MAHPRTRSTTAYEAGDAWLADCSAYPTDVRAAWRQETLASIASGEHWLVAETALLPTMHALKRIKAEHQGPVLVDPDLDRGYWLVPLNADAELADIRQVTVHPPRWRLRCPPTRAPIDGRIWMSQPDGSGLLTDPAALAAALGPGGAYRLPSEVSR
ncbi:hypothetical protein [Streptomyces canus]|uniref:hypothetical protein n=1 Tax=Streptomyces canus TaxID=58343 RepID=UPI003867143F|nr:hypothetical protein OH824_18035 [Streptomyces canus]